MIEYQTEPYTDKEILDNLHPFVREWFTTKFEAFSPPQRYSIRNIQLKQNSLISSPTGSGKCITPDTTLLIEEKGYTKLVTGEQLIKKTSGTPIIANVEETGKLHHVEGLSSYSFTGSVVTQQPAMVFHEEYKGDIIRIKTKYGREVKVSPDHPLLVERHNGAFWVSAKNIQEGDRVGVPREIPLPEKEIQLPWKSTLKHIKAKAKYVVDYETYTTLKKKTNNFTIFDNSSENYYPLQLLSGMSMEQIAIEVGCGLTTVHNLFQGKSFFARDAINAFFSKTVPKTFEKNRVIVQGNDGTIVSFTFPKFVDERIARWTAFVTAEGHITPYNHKSFISVSQKKRTRILELFLRDTIELFDLEFKKKGDIDFTLHSTYATLFICKLLGIRTGRGKYVDLPDWLLNCEKQHKQEFLRVFLSLEGEVRKNEVRLVQASKQKIELINYLFLSFGIFCSLQTTTKYATNSIAKTRRKYHTLTVRGIAHLSKLLSFDIDHQNIPLVRKYCTGKPSGKTIEKHLFDYKKINELTKNYSTRRKFEEKLGAPYEVTRRTGYLTEDAMRKVIPCSHNNQQLLCELAEKTTNNLMWLEVIEKQVTQYKGKLVDLSVPGFENFIGGHGGMYLHNTLSAFLAIINELVTKADLGQLEDKVYCVYLSPLKALANDINKNLTEPLKEIKEIGEKNGRTLDIRVGTRTGDTTPSQKAKMLRKAPHILITTPESLAIMLTTMKFSELMNTTQYLIVDEIHALAENKRGTHMTLSIERLERRASFTRIGLSATVAPLEEVAKFLVGFENGEPRPCKIIDVNKLAAPKDAADADVKKLDLKVLSPVPDLMDASHTKMQHEMYDLIHNLIQQHRSTLIFTNTRAGTERVVHQLRSRYSQSYSNILDADEEQDELVEAEGRLHEHLDAEAELPDYITKKEFIGAHHGSLAKKHRLKIENMLRAGELKSVVCSTSLELGIDIGFIDLVILLGSPKSVARALQRIGRSGHKLHAKAKGRIIVLDRDDLVECSVLLKSALAGKIDRIRIPKNCLDVLAQQLYGIAIEKITNIEDAWKLVTSAYPYHELTRKDFDSTMNYLAGAYKDLEQRNVYAKIWMEKEEGTFGKRGKLARLIYMTNVGTIPDETSVKVKIQELVIGTITEDFAEKLKTGDVFVLGGEPYEFRFSRGTTVQVRTSAGRLPTVPSWVSEMLPLNFDLAVDIQTFRKYLFQLFRDKKSAKKIKQWIREYLPVDNHAVESLYRYFSEQHKYSMIPHRNAILIEHFKDGNKKYVFVHALFGRRTSDVLARAIAYANGRITGRDVEIGITDNGFYLKSTQPIQAKRAFQLLKPKELYMLMELALEKSEVLKRRFRHCATRGMMILKRYKGKSKSVGRQQMSSQIIMATLRKLDPQFPILKEARREILQDLMDIEHARLIIEEISKGTTKIEEKTTELPSPFAFNMIMQGYTDLLKMEDKVEFVRRLHKMVLKEIGGSAVKKQEVLKTPEIMYEKLWDKQQEEARLKEEDYQTYLLKLLDFACRKTKLQPEYREYLQNMIREEKRKYPQKFLNWLDEFLQGTIPKSWADDLVKFLKDNTGKPIKEAP